MIIRSEKELDKVIAEVESADKWAVDTEGTIKIYPNWHLTGISISTNGEDGYYIPVGHQEGTQLPAEYVTERLKPYFENDGKTLFMANSKFDMKVFRLIDPTINFSKSNAFCTMTASFTLNVDNEHGLKESALREFDHKMLTLDEIGCPKKKDPQIGDKVYFTDQMSIEDLAPYATDDAVQTYRLGVLYSEKIDSEDYNKIYYELEMPFMFILMKMEEAGIKLDKERLIEFMEDAPAKLEQLEKEIFDELPIDEPVNLLSNPQMNVVLFDKIGIKPRGKQLKSGGWSVTNDYLNLWSAGNPVCGKIADYRKLNKLFGNYLSNLYHRISSDGRIRCNFNRHVAATGRLSCVPLDAEIFTADGWKFHNELSVGDTVLGFNLLKRDYCWTTVTDIHVGKDEVGLLKVNKGNDSKYNRGFLCTANHKWVVEFNRYYDKNYSNVIGFAETATIPRSYDLLLFPRITVDSDVDKEQSILTEDQAFLLGWFLTDGFLTGKQNNCRYGLGISVTKQRSINSLQEGLKNIPHSLNVYNYATPVYAFHIGVEIFDPIYNVMKSYTPAQLLLKMSHKARVSMFDAMMEGDGSRRKNAKRYDRFGAARFQEKPTVDFFETLCLLLGKPYGVRSYIPHTADNEFLGYHLWDKDLTANKNSRWTPLDTVDVWCPETTCGTWVMRYNNHIAITGNSSKPNLQNIPRPENDVYGLRKLFVAGEGKDLIVADYSQIELRLDAHLSQDPAMIKAFMDGEDVHSITAKNIFKLDCPASEVKDKYPIQRQVAKTINFGIIYEAGPTTLTAAANKYIKDEKDKVTEEYMKKAVDLWFRTYRGAERFIEICHQRAIKNGYVKTIIGRKRPILDAQIKPKTDDDHRRRYGAFRKASNTPVQGSAADVLAIAMRNIEDRFIEEGFGGKYDFVLQIHDEIVIETDEDITETCSVMVKKEMEKAVQLRVPLVADVAVGKVWGDIK